KKDLLILIYHHLMDHGSVCVGRRLEVCDNVDLETVLMEYQTYHYIKFNKYPRLTRRSPPTGTCLLNALNVNVFACVSLKDIYVHNPNRLVKEAVVYPIKYPQLFTGILSPWKGLLLYGPPGTGKTLLAKAVATECSTTFFNISASTIISKWRGLREVLFELAKFHSVMGQRGGGHGSVGEHEGSRRMKTELLIQMDGLAASDHLVFILAASNMPWELDQAMLRRLEKRILIGLPSEPARQAMISHWLPPVSLSGGRSLELNWTTKHWPRLINSIIRQLEYYCYSGSDLRLVCKEAAMRPVRKILHTLETPGNSPLPVINLETVTTEDFLEVMTHTKPSARTLTHRYTEWERDYQSV
uniref:AAA+ ATPase domain-containing protein n=1 Tax=Gadus morhua TaxID=8049 RepID=A0A8C4ZIR5_GADMO